MEKIKGKPSMDKPWLKYYNQEILDKKLPEKTIYEYVVENNVKKIEKLTFFNTETLIICFFLKEMVYYHCSK